MEIVDQQLPRRRSFAGPLLKLAGVVFLLIVAIVLIFSIATAIAVVIGYICLVAVAGLICYWPISRKIKGWHSDRENNAGRTS